MAVDIVRNEVFSRVVTRQDLYDMIWTSTLTGVDYNSLDAAAKNACVWVATDPPASMTNGAWWFDQRWQLLRVFDSTASYACAIGPDRFEVPMRAAVPLGQGWGVKLDADLYAAEHGNGLGVPWVQPCGAAGLDWLNCVGIVSETADSGSYVPVTVEGLVPAYFGDFLTGKTTNPAPPGQVVGNTGYTGLCAYLASSDSQVTLFGIIGHLVEKTDADTRVSMCLFIKFFGPRWMGRSNTAGA